jgi:hypothetical protein
MNIQRALIVLLTCCIAGTPLTAQSTRTYPRAKKAMWAELGLSESQQTRVKNIHDKYAAATKLAQKQSRDSANRVYDHEMSDVRAILSMTQQQTFDSYMQRPRRGAKAGAVRVMPARVGVPH